MYPFLKCFPSGYCIRNRTSKVAMKYVVKMKNMENLVLKVNWRLSCYTPNNSSKNVWEKLGEWKVLIFFYLTFTEEFFVDFRISHVKLNRTLLLKESFVYSYLLCMSHEETLKIILSMFFWKLLSSVEFCYHTSSW